MNIAPLIVLSNVMQSHVSEINKLIVKIQNEYPNVEVGLRENSCVSLSGRKYCQPQYELVVRLTVDFSLDKK